MRYRAALFLLFGSCLGAAEFQSGQAAYAVLGQSSFTSRDGGIKATSLSIDHGHLYAADAARHVFAFDLSQLPDVRSDFASRSSHGCTVCKASPSSSESQGVMPGVAAVSVWGKRVAITDAAHHHVFLWRDSANPRPDIVLGSGSSDGPATASTLVSPVSVALDGKRVFVGDAALHRVLVWNSFPSSDDQPADVVLGQADFAASVDNELSTAASIAEPSAIVSDGANLFVADSSHGRIVVFSPGDRTLASDAVVNSASLVSGPVGPGTLVTINASDLAGESLAADTAAGKPLPKRLGSVEVILNGQALPLLSVSPEDVQAQIPYDLVSQSGASLYIRREQGSGAVSVTTAIDVKIVPANPGLFAFTGAEPREGILLHGGEMTGAPVTPESPVITGEVITIWATGLGSVADSSAATAAAGTPFEGPAAAVSNPISAKVSGLDAQIISANLPEGATGVYQIEVIVPAGLPHQSTGYLSVSQNGYTSNAVSFPLR